MKKKTVAIILIVLCLLGVAGKFAYDKVTTFMIKTGLQMIATTDQKSIEKLLKDSGKNTTASSKSQETNSEKNETDAGTVKEPIKDINNISPEDKAYIMSIYSRYTAAEIKEASELIRGPLTREKKARIKSIVFGKMTRDEYNKVMQIAHKYGY